MARWRCGGRLSGGSSCGGTLQIEAYQIPDASVKLLDLRRRPASRSYRLADAEKGKPLSLIDEALWDDGDPIW